MDDRICPQCGKATSEPVCPEHDVRTVLRTLSAVEAVLPGSLIDGRYRVEKILGKGGFGAVYQATNNRTQQKVVVKVLKPDLTADPTQVQRFHNEARTMSLLSHPNTVRVYDFGQTESGLLFIAMELLGGTDLAAVLREQKTLEPIRAVRIAIAVLNSLAEAHEAGLVHRDLKPDNIFLSKVQGEDDYVRVIDFGIAKATNAETDSGLTKTGFTVGTPKYMSPEQVLNKPLDGRSDLYALGVILYQCLSGDVPFGGQSPMETLMMHLQQPARPLREMAAQALPRGLNDIVMRALRKQPWERFADSAEMRAALEEVRDGHAEGAVRPSRLAPEIARTQPLPGKQREPNVHAAAAKAMQDVLPTTPFPGKGRAPAIAAPAAVSQPEARTAVLDSSEIQAMHAATDLDHEPLGAQPSATRRTGKQTQPKPPRTDSQRLPAPEETRLQPSQGLPALLDPEAAPGPPPRRAGLYVLAIVLLIVAAAGSAWWLGQPAQADAARLPEQQAAQHDPAVAADKAEPVRAASMAGAAPASDLEPPDEAGRAGKAQAAPAAARVPAAASSAPQEPATPLSAPDIEQLQAAAQARFKLCLQAFPNAVAQSAVTAAVSVDGAGKVLEVALPTELRDLPVGACITTAIREQHVSPAAEARRGARVLFSLRAAPTRRPAAEVAPRPAHRKSGGAARSNGDEAL